MIVLDYARRETIEGKEEELGRAFEVEIDLNFADDIALLSDEIDHSQKLLLRVEKSVEKAGFKINAGKTNSRPSTITKEEPSKPAMVQILKKATTWSTLDIKFRKAASWRACNKLTKIWKSSLHKAFKLRMFTASRICTSQWLWSLDCHCKTNQKLKYKWIQGC